MVALRPPAALATLAALVFLPLTGMPAPEPPDLPPVLPWLARPGAAAMLWLFHTVDPPPGAYAAAVLILHAAASLLFAQLMSRLFPLRAALIAALIYALHPLQTETLALAATAAALPGIVLLLAALHLHLDGRKRAALILALLAVLFEPAAAIIPSVFLLIARATPMARPLVSISAAGAVVWLAAFAAVRAQAAASWPWLGVFTLRSLFVFFFPLGLTPWPDLHAAPWQAALAALAVAAAAWAAMIGARRTPAGAWMLAAIALLMSVYFLPAETGRPSMALPLLALAPSAALALEQVDARLTAIYIAMLALLSHTYARQWRDPVALWMEAVRLAPDRVEPRLALAPRLPPAQALELLVEARRRWSRDSRVAVATGHAFLRGGRPREAMAEFDDALTASPRNAAALAGRAAAWLALGQENAAREEVRRALAVAPCSVSARMMAVRLGEVLPDAPCTFTRAQRRVLAEAISRR